MSLISRIEITNYLTEGINANRRIANWRPMISTMTLRMDNKSALINLTNGGGKTSMADLVLFLLSRDSRLLSKVRDKCSPKEHGYTHARIEFRDTTDDSYVSRSLLETDSLNLPGQTYVVGVVLNDKSDEQPIFYTFSGTLEDSPCYEARDGIIKLIADTRFTEKTKSLRGCTWNKYPTKNAWEDAISLHVSTDVVRRNVKYQVEGSDDKNAQFFSFKLRGGETYAEAFFRSVVAPDLLTNILSTWAEEGEQSIEDTLYLSLSQIVKTDDEIAKKESILQKRRSQLQGLEPLLIHGEAASSALSAVKSSLERIRKDAALAEHFGTQGDAHAVPGIPKSPESVLRDTGQDPRILKALRGMFLTSDASIMIFDRTLAELANVDVSKLNEAAGRKGLRGISASSQVIDFTGDTPKLTSGARGGGV